ncbi:hypothetical protein F1640_18485 [Novosphingobium sp. NBM11]|nr:hypothetical protein [Novosphingobium sp. NBM11]
MPAVYIKIAQVQAELAKTGISKSRQNTQQNYQYRGIDEIYNELSPLLAQYGLCILPRMKSREVTERKTSRGGVLFYVMVEAEFDFIAIEDGSTHVVRTYGEAMDSADKATNKAMSAAYKYAVMMSFAIPTEGDNDADATTHTVAPKNDDGPGNRGRGQAANRANGNNQRNGNQRGGDNTQRQQNGRDQGGMPDEAFSRLAMLLRSTNTSPGVLCDHYKVDDLRKLSKDDYEDAVERLEDQIAREARQQSNNRQQAREGTSIHPPRTPPTCEERPHVRHPLQIQQGGRGHRGYAPALRDQRAQQAAP